MAADDIMLGWGRVYPTGMCLRTVYRALAVAHGADLGGLDPRTEPFIYLGSWEPVPGAEWADRNGDGDYDAIDVWNSTPAEHRHTDRHPPKGAPMFFEPNHVVLARGRDEVLVTTDFPAYSITEKTIGYLEQRYGRYLGWTSRIGGHDLTLPGFAGTPEEDDMPYTPEQLAELFENAAISAFEKLELAKPKIQDAYWSLLGRGPSTTELAYYAPVLVKRGELAVYRAINASSEDDKIPAETFVRRAYSRLLARDPKPEDLVFWVSKTTATNRGDVYMNILAGARAEGAR